jgi:hypothetical protein
VNDADIVSVMAAILYSALPPTSYNEAKETTYGSIANQAWDLRYAVKEASHAATDRARKRYPKLF